MDDFMQVYKNTTYSRKLPDGGSMEVGIPRSETAYALSDDTIQLRGPPIAVYHPPEYNVLKWRTYHLGGTHYIYEDFKYGIAGIYNKTRGEWCTSKIEDVDRQGTTITMDTGPTSKVYAGDRLLIYYYARPNLRGGSLSSIVVGDELLPEVMDLALRVWNDSIPHDFVFDYDEVTDRKIWRYYSKLMSDELVNPTSGNVHTLMNNTSWNLSTMLPVEVCELVIDVETNVFTETLPSEFYVQINADGKCLTIKFDGTDGYMVWGSTNCTAAVDTDRGPGRLFDVANDYEPFWEAFINKDSDLRFVFDLGKLQILNDFEVKIKYVRGSVIPSINGHVRGYGPTNT